MSVVISRSKKHLSLGRLMTQASTSIAYLNRVRQFISLSLNALANLEESYKIFEDNGKDIPKQIMSSVNEEQEGMTRVSKSLLMILNVVDGEMKKVSANLENFHKELEKAEKKHERDLKKAQKSPKLSNEGAIRAVTAEILAAKKDELDKK